MPSVVGAVLGAGAPLAAWYRSLTAGERLALALCLSLALHASAVVLLPPASAGAGSGGEVLTVGLKSLAPPLSPPAAASGSGLPAALSPVTQAVAMRPLSQAGAAPGIDDIVSLAVREASVPAAAPGEETALGKGGGGYFAAAELDTLARPLQPIGLVLPADAPDGETRLTLGIYINELGGVDAVEVEQADPSGVLEREARRAFQDVRFVPGWRHGRAVKSYKRIEVWMQN